MKQHEWLMDEKQTNSTQEVDSFGQTVLILSIQSLTFTVYCAWLAYVVWKIKGNIMTRLRIILGLFALIFLFRLTLDILTIIYFEHANHTLSIIIMKICRKIFTKLLWFGIYYFILEISDIKNKLQSQSIEEYQRLSQSHKLRSRIVLTTYIVLCII